MPSSSSRTASSWTCTVFDDARSLAHTLLGAYASLARCLGPGHRVAAALLVALFLAYEKLEDLVTGRPGAAKCDIVEMLAGAAVALPLC